MGKTWSAKKEIDGDIFTLLGTSKTKSNATKRAEFARTKRKYVRVLNDTDINGGFNYAIYISRK